MDERLKNIVDNFEAMKIGVDEPFPFHCTMCGKCCINREDILLTPKDIYNMAKEPWDNDQRACLKPIARLISAVIPVCR